MKLTMMFEVALDLDAKKQGEMMAQLGVGRPEDLPKAIAESFEQMFHEEPEQGMTMSLVAMEVLS